MKYLLVYDNAFGHVVANQLQVEIERFDVRADVKLKVHKEVNVGKELKWMPDLVLQIGISRGIAKAFRKKGIRVGVLLTENKRARRVRALSNWFDLILTTFPSNDRSDDVQDDKVRYMGNPISDLVRNHQHDPDFNISSTRHSVAVLPGNSKKSFRSAVRYVKKLASKSDWNYFIVVQEKQEEHSLSTYSNIQAIRGNKEYELLKLCNAAITFDEVECFQALFSNCPQLKVENHLWGMVIGSKSTVEISQLAECEIIKTVSKTDEIKEELDEILNNHEYCASMLEKYQDLKDKIGMEPAFRKAGRIITEWIGVND